MSEVKRIKLQICETQSQLLEILVDKILNLTRIGLSVLLSAGMTAMILVGGVDNDAAAPLAIFSGLITALFLILFGFAVSVRPKLRRQIRAEAGKDGQALFEGTSFTVALAGEPVRQMPYKAIRGQYWLGDHYILHIDEGDYRTLLCFAIDGESFDNLYMLADALTRRKVKLVRVKTKQKV